MDRRNRALRRMQAKIESSRYHTLAVELQTLLPVPIWAEDDLYALMEPEVRTTAGLTDMIDFASWRKLARGGTLEAVYDDLSARVMGVNLRPLAARERELRMRLPVLMQDVHALIRLAKRLGKRVVLYEKAPNWLTAEEVRHMLAARGAEEPDVLCVGSWDGMISAPDTVRLSSETLPSMLPEVKRAAENLHARQGSFLASGEALRFVGIRAMHAMTAFHPSLANAPGVGYGKFGLYLFSQAVWLAEEVRRGGFDRLVFLARDGWWVKQAFDCIAAATGLTVRTDYVRISRQAAFPLHFRTRADLLSLPLLTDMTAHTPRTLLRLLEPVISGGGEAVMKQHGLQLDERLTEEASARFAQIAAERLFDEARAAQYRAFAAAYLKPHFAGRCATFDVGYNLRSEHLIREVTGADVTAFITHSDSDMPKRRGVPYRTLYPASPWVSWIAREQFLLEDGPACVGYDAEGPVLGEDAPVHPAIRRAQQEALAFVEDMARAYGPDLLRLHFRPADGCAAFEAFLHGGPYRLMKTFRDSCVENGFHTGGQEEDSPFLQWLLMQTDFRAAKTGEPRALTKLRRLLIRVCEEPRSVARRILRR